MQPLLSFQQNFRDLGGIPAKDGRKVKPGLLFRSGDFYSLSPDDIGRLEEMRLATIIDFRAIREITGRPDKTIRTVKEIIEINIHDAAREQSQKFLSENNAPGLENLLIGDYTRMIRNHQPDFRKFLDIVANTVNLPLVFHCAAGKDRTGLAAVFLLSALGVDMEHIREDYMATNKFAAVFIEKIIKKVNDSGLNGAILRPLLEVRAAYLDAALEEILNYSVSLDAFVTDILKADKKKLQEKYLEN